MRLREAGLVWGVMMGAGRSRLESRSCAGKSPSNDCAADPLLGKHDSPRNGAMVFIVVDQVGLSSRFFFLVNNMLVLPRTAWLPGPGTAFRHS